MSDLVQRGDLTLELLQALLHLVLLRGVELVGIMLRKP